MNPNSIKSVLAIISITILIFLYGCFPAEKAIPYYTISEEFSSYCWFDTTSSWNYQNDSILSMSTVTIDEVTDIKRLSIVNENFHYQAVEMFAKSNDLKISKYELTAGDYSSTSGEMNSLLRAYYDDGSYQIIFSPKYPIGEDVILGDEIGTYTNVEIINNFDVLGNIYNNVYHTRIVISVNADIEYNYWIAPNYGIIKSVTSVDGQTTSISLKSSNLFQPDK